MKSQKDEESPMRSPARQNAHPATNAKTMLAIETWLGVTPTRAIARATTEGHAAARVASGLRFAGSIGRHEAWMQSYSAQAALIH
jgi:hypothetical protein